MKRVDVDNLYKLYEFEKDKEVPSCTVYVYEQGYFNNAEMVVFDHRDERVNESIKEDYIRMGFSFSSRDAKDFNEIKDKLFEGFFKISASCDKILHEYDEYVNRQSKRLGGSRYSYIESKYLMNGHSDGEHIVQTISRQLLDDGAQLVILEAPAGFGKTCTSYEIARLMADPKGKRVPILAELSKNRSARIFSYVLLTEIDRKFPRLSSRLVTEQIKEGNVPLIIDGFDELLSKSSAVDEDSSEEAKTMLDTIADFYAGDSRAKILLTSRKSSIFVGEVFDRWVSNRLEHGNVSRIQILPPTVKDWIGYEKEEWLKRKNMTFENIANPVLLAMLRNIPLETYPEMFRDASDILKQYFRIMLEREQERQQLQLSVDEQKDIMRKLASMMAQLDISSDEAEGIQALLEDIVSPKMAEYLRPYNERWNVEEAPPSEEEFVMKLAHSALLDRISMNSNNIGFINEFIYGLLIGDALLEGDMATDDISDKYLSLAVASYTSEQKEKRNRLYCHVWKRLERIGAEERLSAEMSLCGELKSDYDNNYISDITFKQGFNFDTGHVFSNCIFVSCIFDNSRLRSSLFNGCQFISCTFYDVLVDDEGKVKEESAFISCKGHEKLEDATKNKFSSRMETVKDSEYYEKLVLEQYWMIGSKNAARRRTYRTLFKGVKEQDKQEISSAIQRLITRDILRNLTYCIELNFSKLEEIKAILGR